MENVKYAESIPAETAHVVKLSTIYRLKTYEYYIRNCNYNHYN